MPFTIQAFVKQTNTHTNIIAHNDSIGEDYRFWSPSFNIHFGYWRWGINPFDREAMLKQMNEAVLKQLNLPPDQPSLIIDAGCGAGATLRHIVRQIPKVSAKGISLAPWLLEKGKTLNKQEGLDARIELIKADFQSIPLPDGCADAVFCLESVCYASGKKKEQLIQELYRVLKPGGRLVIVDAFRKQPSPMPLFFEKLFQRNAQLWAVEKLAILPLFEKTLTSTGFIKINIQDISWRSAPTALHIPFVVGRLLWHGTWRRNQYWKALLMTSITGLLMHWMGYYLITGTKQ